MAELSDRAIIASWHKNAVPWVKAIANEEIESRVAVTNQAVLDAVLKEKPISLLDMGCGEGWLIRELVKAGVKCVGMDVVPKFAEHIQSAGAEFVELSYEEFSPDAFQKKFDLLVCNFSLLGKESVENVVARSKELLNEEGALIVQTIHPAEASTEENYVDGWREGNWSGFGDEFTNPAPWYFRSLESWKMLFEKAGYDNLSISEPRHPITGKRHSVLFVARVERQARIIFI